MRRTILIATLALSCGGSNELASSGSGGGSMSSTSGASTGSGTGGGASTSGGTGGASAGACSGLTIGPGDHDESIATDSGMRTFHVHAPSSYSPEKPTSLVLLFHGLSETSSGIESLTGMTPVSDAHGFLVVYPQGLGDSWNAGTCCGSSVGTVDDVKFVAALLDRLEAEYCIDKKRVFSSGFSNGGMLSHRLACEMSDRIAAIGAVSGTLAISACTPTRPVPVMHVHGTADFVVPYNGGNLGGAKSVPDTIGNWTKIDACTDGTPTNVYKQGDASCDEYQKCAPGTAVRLCTIDQGGHQWPGGQTDFLGKLSTDLHASEEIAKFLEAHPMP